MTLMPIRDVYNGISNSMDSNPSVFESKSQSFFKYLDKKEVKLNICEKFLCWQNK